MFIEIHFPYQLPVDRDEIEDAISDAVGDDGEITGAGTGAFGSNLDVEITSSIDKTEVLSRIRRALRPFNLRLARARFGPGEPWEDLVGDETG